MQWKSEKITIPSGSLSLHEIGYGKPLLFLHGGPGDTHDYLREVAEEMVLRLQNPIRCILYDQRGNGGSQVLPIDASTISLQAFFTDILRIQQDLDTGPIHLVGHSWGAMLALFFNLFHPEAVASCALISMGPLDKHFGELTNANLVANLSKEEKIKWDECLEKRILLRDQGRMSEVTLVDRELMVLRVKAWVYHEELREPFLESYFKEPPTNRIVHKLVWDSIQGIFQWDLLQKIKTPLWVCSGIEDYLPIEQSEKLASIIPHSMLTKLPHCGHIPWLDQKELFYTSFLRFLNSI